MASIFLTIIGWVVITVGLGQLNEILAIGYVIYGIGEMLNGSELKRYENLEKANQIRHKELVEELTSLKDEIEKTQRYVLDLDN